MVSSQQNRASYACEGNGGLNDPFLRFRSKSGERFPNSSLLTRVYINFNPQAEKRGAMQNLRSLSSFFINFFALFRRESLDIPGDLLYNI